MSPLPCPTRSSSDSQREFAERRILVAEQHDEQARWYRRQSAFFSKKGKPATAKQMLKHAHHFESQAREARLAAQSANEKAEELDGTKDQKEMVG